MMKLRLILIVLIGFGLLAAKAAISPPELRCVAVNSDGSIVLSWNLPTGNPAEFINYSIFSATAINGPYQLIDSVTNFNTQSFTDGASLGSIFYFIRTKYDDGTGVTYSATSDTMANIVLNVSATTGNNFPPVLTWNRLRTPNIASNSGTYLIFRKKNFIGNWTLIDSTTYGNETYIDNSIVTCRDSLYYRITTFDNLPCMSISTVDSELFIESTAPNIPSIDSISVDTSTGFVHIGWSSSSSPDTEGYVIYYGNGVLTTDTVYGINTNYFFHQTSNANQGPQTFTIAAFDTCGNYSATTNIPHTTMFVTTSENLCSRSIEVSWTPYIGFSSITSYDVFAAQDNGPFQLVGSVSGTENTYIHSGLNSISTYCYVIVANSLGKTSRSNITCQGFNQLNLPAYHYNTFVSVAENNQFVEAELITDTTADVTRYELKRSYYRDGNYITVDVITDVTDTVLSFIDSTSRASQMPYYYKIDAIDSCDQVVVSSNISRTIFLDIQENLENYHHNLDWNKYRGWDSLGLGVQKYRILYSFEPEPAIALDSVNNITLDYLHPYFDIRNDGGTFCYQIEAQESAFNWIQTPFTSLSNKVCIKKESIVYIPTIFTPNSDGRNDVFLPEIQFVDAINYTMVIFDRWGNPVAEFSDPRVGWDGLINGNQAPIGGYVYYITFTTPKGSFIEKRGAITLYR